MDTVLSAEIKRAVHEALLEAGIGLKPLNSVRNFAKLIDSGPTFVYGEIRTKKLRAVRHGDKFKITGPDGLAYIASLPDAQAS